MYKLELSQQSLNPFKDNSSKKRSKENDPKYLNAIKPYIKQRKNSKRDIPKLVDSRSKSRRNESCKNIQLTMNPKQLGQIYQQLVSLKSQYHSLKISYNTLIKQKNQLDVKTLDNSQNKLESQLSKAVKQVQKYKNNNKYLQNQIQRLKKECIKTFEQERFKQKKLEQTLQQKQLMIAYLRSQLAVFNSVNVHSTSESNYNQFFMQNTAPIFNSSEHLAKVSQNSSIISSQQVLHPLSEIPKKHEKNRSYVSDQEEDSLSFSRDNRQFQSVHSLLSNAEQNENQHDNTIITFTKKDVIILQQSIQKINQQGQEDCLTFENRKEVQQKIQNLPLKISTKRLQISTQQNSKYGNFLKEGQSLQTKKRSIKPPKKKTVKKKK